MSWTTRRLLEWMTGHFDARGVESPRVVAEMLLAHVHGCERMRLYMEVDRAATADQLATLRALVKRAADHEPVQYLVGEAWFFSRAFTVDRSVLIPRPCTEMLLEHVLQWLRATPGHAEPLLADVCTGSGCIAISLAAQIADANVVATDVDGGALELARANAERHGVADRIEFIEGEGLTPLREHRKRGGFDAICSNPPYISDTEWASVPPNVKDYEPELALRGGPDGLDVVRPILAGAAELLSPGGELVIEIADAQHDAVLELARAEPLLENSAVTRDHEGLRRMLAATAISSVP